ncbi:MAG TPA: hypothetical protein VHV30_09875 [Polyangiaceae bacterium]|jgi:hypothetical protein|nr:hypothetical protein [Polyangiaceae bacterium]
MDVKAAGAKAKRIGIRIAIGLPILVVLGLVLYTEAALHFAYSSGEHVGFVQKMAKKGWICHTNEGDLAMVNMAGQQAQMFYFTVRDDDVMKKIESFEGHRVSLAYEEHRGLPSSCFGETPYFVVDARKVE